MAALLQRRGRDDRQEHELRNIYDAEQQIFTTRSGCGSRGGPLAPGEPEYPGDR